MMHGVGRVRILLLLFPCVVGMASGCGGGGSKKSKIWVYQYPDFYQPSLKRVAVLPFANRTRVAGVGARISDTVSAILTNNGTYEVYTRAHLKDILAERDLADAGIIDGDVAIEIGRLKSVQALVCGVCDRYETATKHETRYRPEAIWGRNQQGQAVITGWRQVPYQWTRHDGFVECQVVVIDCTTGRQIAAVRQPSNWWASGSPPKYGPADAVRNAEQDQVARIARAIAVTRSRIKLKGKVLRTATDLYDQEWDWQKEILPSDEHFSVVVKLPAEADRNNFKITVVPKDRRDVVVEHAFVWSKANERQGFRFKVGPIVEKFGFGEYQAKLYSGPEPIARYTFKIVEER